MLTAHMSIAAASPLLPSLSFLPPTFFLLSPSKSSHHHHHHQVTILLLFFSSPASGGAAASSIHTAHTQDEPVTGESPREQCEAEPLATLPPPPPACLLPFHPGCTSQRKRRLGRRQGMQPDGICSSELGNAECCRAC